MEHCISCGKKLSNKSYTRCKKCNSYYMTSKEHSLRCMEAQNFVDREPNDTIDELSERNYNNRLSEGFAMLNGNY